MNLTITQDNSRTETINSTIIDRLYEIAFAASTDPNSTVSLTGRLESPTGYAAKIEWLNTNFSPDLTITVPTSGQYIFFRDPAVEAVLIAGGFSTDGVGVSLTDAEDATFTSDTFLDNTDITSFSEFNLFTKANTNPPSSLFSGCSNLAEIDFSNVLKIGNKEFKRCSSLTGDLRLPNLSEFSGNEAFRGCTGITKILNLGNITSLPSLAFRECTGITEVTIPSTCTTLLDWGVFSNCSNLTKVIGLENLTKMIGSYLFSECDLDLTTLPNPWNIIQIGPSAFNGSKIHGEINFPKISSLGSDTFWGCKNITKLKCLGKLSQIPGRLVANDSQFIEAYIPFECTSIDGQAFRTCKNMTTIKLYTLSVDDWVEGQTPTYTNISRVTTFGSECFRECNSLSLTNADITNATSIGNYAFNRVNISGNITLNNLSTIGDEVFGSAPITSLDLSGSTINKVGVSICNNNPSLISVKLPKTVTTYGRTWSAAPFTNCNNITTFTGFEGITVINNSQRGLHINNAIPLLSLETSELFILKASDNGASCSASLVYLPKFKYSTISEFTSHYTEHISSSFFSYQSTNSNHVFNTNLMYFKDLEKIQLAMFFKTTISNLVINKATPPTFDTNVTISPSVTVIAQGNWDTKMFGNISTSTMTIYVPNSAVSTYLADPNYNSYTILGIGSLNGGVIYLTENDWVAANKPNGLIAEYLGLDNTTIINNNKTELDLFIDNNNLTCWTNPNT